jgi:AcrR family transcriptional regulator
VARPKRQHERRAQLVEIARQLVVERGVVALRLTDVAKRAGLSPASVLYYFSALSELLKEVQDQAVERFCSARAEVARQEKDPRRRLVAMIRSGLPTGQDDELCRLLYELGTVARRDPAYATRYLDLYHRQVALYLGILEAGSALGVFDLASDSETIARNLVVLEDGYGLHMLMAVATFDVPTAERLLLSYAATATRCDLDQVLSPEPTP